MVAGGESADTLDSARQVLAARDADLAEADRVLIEVVADAHARAVESIGRIETLASEIEAAATDQPRDSPGGSREVGRRLVTKNREIAEVVREAKAMAHAKTVALKQLTERYRLPG